jgi:hypothetical protein
MTRATWVLAVAAWSAIGCGGNGGDSSAAKDKDKDKAKTKAAKSDPKPGDPKPTDPKADAKPDPKTDPKTDPAGGDPKAAKKDDTPPAPAAMSVRDLNTVVALWTDLQDAVGKVTNAAPGKVIVAADVPVDAWVKAGKAPPEVETVLTRHRTDLPGFARIWTRLNQLYNCTLNLPAELDSTREARSTEEVKSNDFNLEAAERNAAKAAVERLLRKRWDDAAVSFPAVAPRPEEFDAVFRNRRSISVIFRGPED